MQANLLTTTKTLTPHFFTPFCQLPPQPNPGQVFPPARDGRLGGLPRARRGVPPHQDALRPPPHARRHGRPRRCVLNSLICVYACTYIPPTKPKPTPNLTKQTPTDQKNNPRQLGARLLRPQLLHRDARRLGQVRRHGPRQARYAHCFTFACFTTTTCGW